MEECECKKTVRTEEEKRDIEVRLNRIIGQMNGIKRMVEEDRYCGDVLIQLSAVDRALKSLTSLVLGRHMHTCLVKDIQNGTMESIDELMELFKRFQ